MVPHEILIRPVISEKNTLLNTQDQYVLSTPGQKIGFQSHTPQKEPLPVRRGECFPPACQVFQNATFRQLNGSEGSDAKRSAILLLGDDSIVF